MSQGDYYVVVGSLNIDLVVTADRPPHKGETVLGAGFGLFPGGKGANQAVQLARLGVETYMVGRVGSDVFADQVVHSLVAAGVKTDYLVRDTERGTGKGCVLTDAAGDNWIVVIPESNMVWQAPDLENARALIQGARALIVQLEIPVQVVDEAIEIAYTANVPVVLNPAPARVLPDTMLRKIRLLVPNQSEASLLANIPVRDVATAKEAARVLQSKGAEIVTITLGNVGSVTASGEEIIHTPAFPVDAVDVTGAGDSFCASLAYALMELSDLGAAVRFATASGALSVTRLGAQPSLPTLERINQFLGQGRGGDSSD